MLKANFLYALKVLFKIDDVLKVRSAPAVNRLVVVADHRHVSVGKQMHHLVLLVACVLEFVHHKILVAVAVLLQNLRELAEYFYRKDNQVVKVDRVVKLEAFLVILVKLAVHVGFDFPILAAGLYVAEQNRDFVAVQGFGAELKLAAAFLYERYFVGFVVNRKVFPPAKGADFLPQNLHAKRVEGGHGQVLQFFLCQVLYALFHLSRGFVGEC